MKFKDLKEGDKIQSRRDGEPWKEDIVFRIDKEDCSIKLCNLDLWVWADQENSVWKFIDENKIDTHYNFNYTLTEQDKASGQIKIDPYFVGSVWKTGSRDDTGALFHTLKTVARFGDKNDKAREIKALYLQAKRLAELNGVDLND